MSGIEKEAREEGGVVDEALEEITSRTEKKPLNIPEEILVEDCISIVGGLPREKDPDETGPHEKTETDKVPEEET